MKMLRYGAVLAAAVLGMAVSTGAQAAQTIFTETFTVTPDGPNSTGGVTLGSSSISGSYGFRSLPNGTVINFSTIQVTANDQGDVFTYDFSYNCNALALGCGNPFVPSQFPAPGASGFPVQYEIETSELPSPK